jgi:hypothetical protein
MGHQNGAAAWVSPVAEAALVSRWWLREILALRGATFNPELREFGQLAEATVGSTLWVDI